LPARAVSDAIDAAYAASVAHDVDAAILPIKRNDRGNAAARCLTLAAPIEPAVPPERSAAWPIDNHGGWSAREAQELMSPRQALGSRLRGGCTESRGTSV